MKVRRNDARGRQTGVVAIGNQQQHLALVPRALKSRRDQLHGIQQRGTAAGPEQIEPSQNGGTIVCPGSRRHFVAERREEHFVGCREPCQEQFERVARVGPSRIIGRARASGSPSCCR